MEQARYWMWMRKKLLMSENVPPYVVHHDYSSTNNNNWEEQAFAEDSAGPLGGFIWPPRSYSCSFCGREFRSAQALGGHMNVHRRDRARLKQLESHDHKVPYTTTTTTTADDHDQVCTMVYNSNPSVVSSSVPLATQKICEETLVSLSHCSSTINNVHDHDQEEKQKGSLLSLDPSRSSDLQVAAKVLSTNYIVSPSKLIKNSREQIFIGFETTDDEEDNYIVKPPADSALMSLYPNSPSTGRRSNIGNNYEDDQVYIMSSNKRRRRRRSDVSTLRVLSLNKQATGSSVDHQCQHDFHKVNGLIPSSMEELDLELRLGDRPN